MFMILLQIQADTTARAIQAASDVVSHSTDSGVFVILSAMLMPLIALAVFSSAKALICVGIDDIDPYDFFAELAIDLLSIFSTFIIGRYILETNPSDILITSFKIIGGMAVGLVFLCFLRRMISKMRSAKDVSMNTVRWIIASEFGIDTVCLFLMVIGLK